MLLYRITTINASDLLLQNLVRKSHPSFDGWQGVCRRRRGRSAVDAELPADLVRGGECNCSGGVTSDDAAAVGEAEVGFEVLGQERTRGIGAHQATELPAQDAVRGHIDLEAGVVVDPLEAQDGIGVLGQALSHVGEGITNALSAGNDQGGEKVEARLGIGHHGTEQGLTGLVGGGGVGRDTHLLEKCDCTGERHG